MYSTCLFCHGDLAANEAIAHFPIGRRLAFDPAKGRLWVVCRKCERWNLTPLEERWEAIEECERAYRDTRLRVATDQIGLAQIGEGLELVRIGEPQRPEFAAWRYGDQFGRRRRRSMVAMTAGIAGAALLIPFGGVIGISLGVGGWNAFEIASLVHGFYARNRIVARVKSADGGQLIVRQHHARDAMLLHGARDEPWGLRIEHSVGRDLSRNWWQYDDKTGIAVVRGEQALRVAAQLLPTVNHKGASKKVVREAITLIENSDTDTLFRTAARVADRPTWNPDNKRGTLNHVPAEILLALEMLSHEESERRAMEGELEMLEAAWRDAEEIAAISDDLFLPDAITAKLEDLKNRRHG